MTRQEFLSRISDLLFGSGSDWFNRFEAGQVPADEIDPLVPFLLRDCFKTFYATRPTSRNLAVAQVNVENARDALRELVNELEHMREEIKCQTSQTSN